MNPPRFISTIIIVFLFPCALLAEPRIALLPFENLSGIRAATKEIMPLIEEDLIQKGYRTLTGDPLEAFLNEERIRYLDSLPTPLSRKLAQRLGVEAILTGTILSYISGTNPQVGLSARLISKEGDLLWGQTVAMTGEDQVGLLGLGTVQHLPTLVPIAVKQLFQTFSVKAEVQLRDWGSLKRFLLPGPRAYRSPVLDSISSPRIGVFPLENQSTNREAGRILLNLLLLRLANRDRFRITEIGDVREGMIAEEIRSFDEMDLAQMKVLGKKLDTKFFIGGTIFKYSEGLGAAAFTSPEIELYLSMLDAETGRIVWTAHHSRKGENYLTILQFGLIRNSVSLADQVLEEMIGTLIR